MFGQHDLTRIIKSHRQYGALQRQANDVQTGYRLHRPVLERDASSQPGVPQPDTKRFTDGLLRGPQPQEGEQIAAHPVQLVRVEPALRQTAHRARIHVLEVDPDRAGTTCGHRDLRAAVAEAHRQSVDLRPAVRGVPQDRIGDEGSGQRQQQRVGGGAGVVTGRRRPDLDTTSSSHRRKVTR